MDDDFPALVTALDDRFVFMPLSVLEDPLNRAVRAGLIGIVQPSKATAAGLDRGKPLLTAPVTEDDPHFRRDDVNDVRRGVNDMLVNGQLFFEGSWHSDK